MYLMSIEAERARLRRAAYHEVGHEVAAHVLPFTLRAITIMPGAGHAARCDAEALQLVGDGWPAVERVADALLTFKSIVGTRAHAIIASEIGPR